MLRIEYPASYEPIDRTTLRIKISTNNDKIPGRYIVQ